MVAQSWIDLNVCTKAPISTKKPERFERSSSKLPSGLCCGVHIGHRGGGIGDRICCVVNERQQLVVVHHPRIGHVHHILRSHLEASGEQHSRRIAKVDMINRWDPVKGEPLGIDSQFLKQTAILITINEYLAWIGLLVIQTASLANRLRQSERLYIKVYF